MSAKLVCGRPHEWTANRSALVVPRIENSDFLTKEEEGGGGGLFEAVDLGLQLYVLTVLA
jgi:hypothetical protein